MRFKIGAQDRRRHPRISISGTASVFGQESYYGQYKIENLSVGGAELQGKPMIAVDEAIIAVLGFSGFPGLRVRARVVHSRGTTRGCRMGIRFERGSPDQEDMLQEVMLVQIERSRAEPLVLVVDGHHETARRLRIDLETLGHKSVVAASALEAVLMFLDPLSRIAKACVVVDIKSDAAIALFLLDFLASEHEAVRRILVSAGSDPPGSHEVKICRNAHAMLQNPWDIEKLSIALRGDALLDERRHLEARSPRDHTSGEKATCPGGNECV